MLKITAIQTLSFFILLTLLNNYGMATPVIYDQWFESYGKVSWEKEKIYLDNFAYVLNKNTEDIGYIAFQLGKEDCSKEIRKHVKKAKNYLVNVRNVDTKRIIIVKFKKSQAKHTVFILQPINKNKSHPKFWEPIE